MFQIYTYTILTVYTIHTIDILGLYRCFIVSKYEKSTETKIK